MVLRKMQATLEMEEVWVREKSWGRGRYRVVREELAEARGPIMLEEWS